MPDNLNISTPISGNTSINRANPPTKEPPQVNVINPAKVTQPNTNKQQTEQDAGFNFLLNRGSVFSTFIEQLRQTPGLSQTLQKIVYDLFSRKESVKDTQGIGALLKQLASSAQTDKSGMLQNLLFQAQNQTKFTGSFFDTLRSLSRKYADSDLDTHLANFLKAYNGVFSSPDTMQTVAKQLETLTRELPRFYSKKLQPLIEELEQPSSNGTEYIEHNLTVLKEKILPLLGEYAAATNDTGRARDTITLLVHNLARLNVGSRADLVEKFSSLLDYCRYSLDLPDEQISTIQKLFVQCLTESSKEPQNDLYESLIRVLSEGSRQSTSNMSQILYKDVCTSLLMDKSVYMPFIHVFLPVNYCGQHMFSEIWIEKDSSDSRSKNSGAQDGAKATRLYLTFDIKNLGYFEASIEIAQLKANISISYPPSLEKSSREIRSSLSQIFAQNGIAAENITLSSDNSPKIPSLITKRVYERRNGIDVSV